ncbi:cupin [Dulcicalothrix desertica PCC 7102]|uniref:Cupin n=1 Tax=Dulcicalothrix desertica PCC 7102 TaxID=232991 RepID=A0A433VDS6_9CYAN|nr:cupin domain-containing protein [Dulcicalothrix desertica]RUT04270.1 cupin [Dulcicalothrix desertica PCC 7102]TWH38842.1 putative cupin superfamily protein [Dulcicalothrix desertica PCC 7102]
MIINPENIPQRTTSTYPEEFKQRVAGRIKQAVGNAALIKNFGVNLVKLAPGSCSALRHWHSKQDEFIYVVEGEITLITNAGEQILTPGMMAGFPAGKADGHHLINKSSQVVIYLEVGDRTPNDEVDYPDDDLIASSSENGWIFSHKDGSEY